MKGGKLLWSSNPLDNHKGRVNKLAACEDEGILFSAGNDTLVKAWDVRNGALLWATPGHLAHSYAVLDLSVVRSDTHFALVSLDTTGMVKAWAVDAEECYNVPMANGPLLFPQTETKPLDPDDERLKKCVGVRTVLTVA